MWGRKAPLDPEAEAKAKALRRKRRWRRTAISLGLGVLISVALALRLWLGMLPHVDYAAKLAELYEQQLPPSARGPGVPNEWSRLQRVLDRVIEVDRQLGGTQDREHGEWFAFFPPPWFDAVPAELAEHRVVAPIAFDAYQRAGIFAELGDTVARPKLLHPIEPLTLASSGDFTLIATMRHLLTALDFDVHRAIIESDGARVVSRLEQLLAVRGVLAAQPGVLEQIAASAFRAAIARRIARDVPAADLNEPSLRALLNLVQGIPRHSPADYQTECMRLEYSCQLQSVFHTAIDPQNLPLWAQRIFLALVRTQSQQQRTLDEICAQAAVVPKLPFAQQVTANAALEKRIDDLGFFDLPSSMLLGPLSHVGYSDTRFECEIAGAILILAIELHRARHGGRPPDSLDDLVPGELAELPRDPFAPDGCFIYRSLADVPGTVGPPYVLYSVGADQTDDGGLIPLEWDRDALQALDHERRYPAPCDHVFTALSHDGWAVRLDERPRSASLPR